MNTSSRNAMKGKLNRLCGFLNTPAILKSDVSRPFEKPKTRLVAVKVNNHLGDAVMKVFGVN